MFAPLDERPDSSGSSVENVNAMALDHGPEAIRLGEVRGAFVHQDGGAVGEWSIDHITVTSDPADVGSTPVKIFILDIEDPLRGQVRLQQVAGGRVQNSFWLTGGSGRVQNVERMLAIEFFRGTV